MNGLLREVLSATGILLLFVGVIAVTETATRRGRLAPETARKAIHLAGGLGCLLFPFLIQSWITVSCLAVGFAITLYAGETRQCLKSLSSVARTSCGSLLFPVAVLLLFVCSDQKLWLYVSALLVLVLADTAAALAGTRFGSLFYETAPGEHKSLEGTAMFALVGFFSVYVPLVSLSGFPHLTCALTALLMALLLAAIEAVSIGGTDNLLVPLGTVFLLLKVPTKPPVEILFQCLSLVGIAVLVVWLNRRRRTLQTRPLIVFVLVAYTAWSLGAVDWMVPVVIGFMAYNWLCAPCKRLPADLTALELLRPLYPSLAMLFIANAIHELGFWFGPFLAATAVATSLCVSIRFQLSDPPQPLRGVRLALTALLPAAVPLLLVVPIQGVAALSSLPVLVTLCALVTLLYNRFSRLPLSGFVWNYAIPLHAAIAALAYAGLQVLEVTPSLEPSTWREVFQCL